MTPEIALQDAISAILLASDPVSEFVGTKVFSEVPTERATNVLKAPPWIYLGPFSRRRIEAGCGQVWTITTRLYAAASTTIGRRQAWELGNAIGDALDGQEPALTAPYRLVEVLRCTQAGDVIEPASPRTVYIDVTAIISRDME